MKLVSNGYDGTYIITNGKVRRYDNIDFKLTVDTKSLCSIDWYDAIEDMEVDLECSATIQEHSYRSNGVVDKVENSYVSEVSICGAGYFGTKVMDKRTETAIGGVFEVRYVVSKDKGVKCFIEKFYGF